MKRIFEKIAIVLFLISGLNGSAQFVFDGQIIQRAEFRHGFGKLIPEGADPAFFIGQRARFHAGYDLKKLKMYISLQDVRTWGNTGQANAFDGLFSVHEAWAEVMLDSAWSIKLGRQELNYDNVRFLGNLDWALQGRSHDFALLKYEKNKMKLHIGAGYNQNGEALSGNIFSISNQYKTAQMMRFENSFGKFDMSFIFWNNGRQFTVTDSLNHVVGKGVRFMQTLGLPTLRFQKGNTTLSGFYYHQFGKDVNGNNVNAFDASVQVSQLVDLDKEKGTKLKFTLGCEALSGNGMDDAGSVNKSYSPLYGTNHLHNGYMDMFFVGGRHENSVGLIDAFLLTRADLSKKVFLSLNVHGFNAYGSVYGAAGEMSRFLGTELDLTFGWLISDAISMQVGYSQMFGTETLEYLQSVVSPASVQNWAYVMMIYRPKMKNRFVGLLN